MKPFLILFLVLFIKPVFSCSELGQLDFKLSTSKQDACAKIASKFAMDFAKSMVKIEKMQKDYKGPSENFKRTTSLPAVYTAKLRAGNSKMIGFNVPIDSTNKWECNFCVNLQVDDKENCRIESVEKFMCAN